jgi:hypothetical protein
MLVLAGSRVANVFFRTSSKIEVQLLGIASEEVPRIDEMVERTAESLNMKRSRQRTTLSLCRHE